ncbi:MAG: zinc-ribbon domain-containing protein [Candidatus Thorarchaeota archaeon]
MEEENMPFCPNCGNQLSETEKFCPNCGAAQGGKGPTDQRPPYQQPYQQPPVVRVTSGHQYDDGICLLLCCCLSPVAALIYYLLTDHPDQQYKQQY